MYSLDNFITQLIHSGLAETFFSAVKEHYLKINIIYDIVHEIDEDDIVGMTCHLDKNDSLTVEITLNREIKEPLNSYNSDFDIQILNCGNSLAITVSNKSKNEGEIYETRFAGHKKTNHNKWS